MKKTILFFLIVFSVSAFGQSTRKIVRDFDGDLKKDTVRIDSDKKVLVCRLSAQKYKKTESGEIYRLNFGNTLVPLKNGFEFWNDFGRSGFQCVFEYSQKLKKFQLVKMRRIDDDLRHDYGEKAKGKSSVNLLTGEYAGDFYEAYQKKLRKMPTIKAKMNFPETYLETFSDILCFEYEKKCVALYEKNKTKDK
ncbi:MAG TPA: hypothetical protein VFR70_04990 [Flavobacterium sp.]|nr:hypothetical protein [Flavobacterium sp.]